jgi:predicted transcriptional regulator
MSKCNINSKQSEKYIGLLRSSDLIKTQIEAGTLAYKRTEAGREFLKYYNKIVNLLDSNIPTSSHI